jgi:hypothetical protein
VPRRSQISLRLCSLALLATVLFATAGGLVHRDHAASSDAACVVHVWSGAAKALDVPLPPSLSLSFQFSFQPLSQDTPAPAERFSRFAPARAPPIVA